MALCTQGSCTGLEGGQKALGLLCTWTWDGQMKDKEVDGQQPAAAVSPAPTDSPRLQRQHCPAQWGATAHTEES